MTDHPVILAVGAVDERGVAGTGGVSASWSDLEADPPGNARTYRRLFGKQDETFRRLDRQTRAIVLAAEACGIDRVLSVPQREEAGLFAETSHGSIEADLKFVRSLDKGLVEAAVFPYVLQSTCVGDVALRHGLHGPMVCLSVDDDCRGETLREAAGVLARGEVPFVVLAAVDMLSEPLPELGVAMRSVVAVAAAPDIDGEPVAPWPADAADPFRILADQCFARA